MSDNEDSDQSTDDSAIVESSTDGDGDDDLWRSLNQMASSLCSRCRDFAHSQIGITGDDSEYRVYHPSMSSFQESTDAGCCLCNVLAQSLHKLGERFELPEISTEPWSIRYRLLSDPLCRSHVGYSHDAFCLQFYLWQSDCDFAVRNSHETSPFATMKFFPVDLLGLGPDHLNPSLETAKAKLTRRMHVARYWYHQCLSHATCRDWRQESRCLPTRLVQIWRPQSDSPNMVSAKLCETSHLPLCTDYVTLSHSWGDKQIFQLRQGNIEEMMQYIPFHQLPQVFQDAMYISTELGINYIWIDSLCIIQDSKEDWVHEAKRMGSVYQYAAFNIAAAPYKESSSLGSFLKQVAEYESKPPMFADCVMEFQNIREARPFKGLYVRAEEAALLPSIEVSVLNFRAWVAQERALSPGIIHFTPEIMWWECNHIVANEAFPTLTLHKEEEMLFRPCKIRTLSVESDPQDIYAFWREFIGRYARTNLTYEQDRFPAAMGIARTLSELIKDNFVAGFWEGDLISSLIMQRHGEVDDVPTTLRAPSWSWASLRAAYDFISGSHSQPLNGVSVKVLSDIPGFKTDLDSPSLEISGVRGLEIMAPLRKLSANVQVNFGEPSDWIHSTTIVHELSDRGNYTALDIPGDQAWRLRDGSHVVVLAKGKYSDRYLGTMVIALLAQQVLEAESHNTFRKLGLVYFHLLTEEKLEEYFGLQKENGQYIPSPVFGECGFQKIVLI